jgi:hypothetical protein
MTVNIQMYLLHYDWEYYFDDAHNIHVELDKGYFQNQLLLLFEHFSKYLSMFFDLDDKEVILFINNFNE